MLSLFDLETRLLIDPFFFSWYRFAGLRLSSAFDVSLLLVTERIRWPLIPTPSAISSIVWWRLWEVWVVTTRLFVEQVSSFFCFVFLLCFSVLFFLLLSIARSLAPFHFSRNIYHVNTYIKPQPHQYLLNRDSGCHYAEMHLCRSPWPFAMFCDIWFPHYAAMDTLVLYNNFLLCYLNFIILEQQHLFCYIRQNTLLAPL